MSTASTAIGRRPVPVLMYHRIAEAASPAMGKFTVAPRDFSAQLTQLRRAGYTGLTVSDFARRAGQAVDGLPSQPIVLTFDDGFEDFGQIAAPLLSDHGFPATLYVVSGQVGGTADWLAGADAQLPLLGWDRLAKLQQQGFEIGAHGASHRALDGLSDDDLALEVAEPRRVMARRLGSAPASFCYPFGFRNERVRRQVQRAGYQSACAVRYGTFRCGDDLFDIARHIVPGKLSPAAFAALAAGHAPMLPLIRDRLRTQAGFVARQAAFAYSAFTASSR